MAKNRLHNLEFLSQLQGRNKVLILAHNDPDPDALASLFGLRRILKAAGLKYKDIDVAYGGVLGRAENRVFASELRLKWKHAENLDWSRYDAVFMVDSQPAVSNHSLPQGLVPFAVFDHHPANGNNKASSLLDIRPRYGATTTIIYEYIQRMGLNIDSHLATILFYGIKSDTLGLSRAASAHDTAAYIYLLQRIEPECLARIERAPLPESYFLSLDEALSGTAIYDNLAMTIIEKLPYPDFPAEFADLILRLEEIDLAICFGVFRKRLIISARSKENGVNTSTLMRRAITKKGTAGGHGHMAGGSLLIQDDPAAQIEQLRNEFLALLNIKSPGNPLIP